MAVLTALLPLSAWAGEPRQHDSGFYLRFAPGGGFSSSKIEEGPDTLELRGLSGNFDLAIGAVVRRNLAIHGTLGSWGLVNPTAEFNGVEEDTSDLSLTMIMFGGGFTYYFGDSNVYVTASAGGAQLTLEIEGDKKASVSRPRGSRWRRTVTSTCRSASEGIAEMSGP